MPQENVTFQQLFDQALASQQQKKGDEALDLYQQVLDKGQMDLTPSQASVVYHNMSTIAFEKSDFLKAYVWSKKAVALDSHNRLAQSSLEQFSKKFEVPRIAHQISTSQNLQKMVNQIPVDLWFILSLLFLFLSFKFFLKTRLENRKKQMAETAFPASPTFQWKSLASFTVLILLLCGTWLRWKDDQIIRGILTAEKSAVQTAAGENKPIIFEAQAGLEVDVLQIEHDYAQVRYPGAFSGWILKKNIEILR